MSSRRSRKKRRGFFWIFFNFFSRGDSSIWQSSHKPCSRRCILDFRVAPQTKRRTSQPSVSNCRPLMRDTRKLGRGRRRIEGVYVAVGVALGALGAGGRRVDGRWLGKRGGCRRRFAASLGRARRHDVTYCGNATYVAPQLLSRSAPRGRSRCSGSGLTFRRGWLIRPSIRLRGPGRPPMKTHDESNRDMRGHTPIRELFHGWPKTLR